MGNFSHNQKQPENAYLLAPGGIKSKAMLTAHFVERTAVDYAMLKSKLEKYDKREKYIKRLERGEVIKDAREAVQRGPLSKQSSVILCQVKMQTVRRVAWCEVLALGIGHWRA